MRGGDAGGKLLDGFAASRCAPLDSAGTGEKLLGYDCAIFFLHFLLVGIHEIVKLVLGLLACGIEFKDHLGYLIVIQRVQEFLELCLRHFAEWGLFRFPECKLVQLTH